MVLQASAALGPPFFSKKLNASDMHRSFMHTSWMNVTFPHLMVQQQLAGYLLWSMATRPHQRERGGVGSHLFVHVAAVVCLELHAYCIHKKKNLSFGHGRGNKKERASPIIDG